MLDNASLIRIFGHIVRNILIIVAFCVIVPVMLNVEVTAVVILGLFVGIALIMLFIKSVIGSVRTFNEMKNPFGEYE